MAFVRSLSIEAKFLQFSVSSSGIVTLSEQSRKSQSSIRFGRFGVVWLANLFGKLVDSTEVRDFSEYFNESKRAFLAQRCSNKNSSYMVLAEFGDRCRRGVVIIPEGRLKSGWKSFATACEELISVLGELRRRRVGPGGSEIRPGSSFAQIVQATAPEKKVAEAKESRGIQMGADTKITQPTVGVPTLTHAAKGMRLTSSNCNHEVGGPAVTAGHVGVLWEHLLRIKGELDLLMELVNNKNQEVEPRPSMLCPVCGFSLVTQQQLKRAYCPRPSTRLGSPRSSLDRSVGRCMGPGPTIVTYPSSPRASASDAEPVSVPSSPGLGVLGQLLAETDAGLSVEDQTSPAKGETASATPVVAGEALRVGGLLSAMEKDASAKVVAAVTAMGSSGLSPAMGAEVPSKAVGAVEAMVPSGLPTTRVVSVGGICSGASEVGQPGQCDEGGFVDVPLCSAVSLVEKEAVGLEARFEGGLSPSPGAACYAGGVPQGLFPQFCDLGGRSALGVVAGGELVNFNGRGAETSVEPLQIVYPHSTSEEGAPPSFWVLEMLSSIRHLVGVSCDGHEEDLVTLFAALEKEKALGSRPLGRSGGKMIRELKSLECSVNYDGSASSSRRSRKVGRALVNYL